MLLTVYDFDWVAAEKELATAAALQPPNCYYYITAANLANSVGHWDEARRLIRQALVLDPLDASARFEPAWGPAFHTAAWDELDDSIRSTLEVDPNFATLHLIYGQSLLLRHRIDEAKAEFQKEPPGTGQLEGLAEAAFAAGDKAASDRYLKDAIALHGKLGSYWIAEAYAYRGERDHAIDWLNQAIDRHDSQLVMLKDDPMLSGIQDDPRFKEFLQKMKLSE
jgi:tetratricopeptide (TPR) repeat protein